ncbi:bifunctional hydroxymethylpyrimidine kinase/phosphomethylpyrimidine kinase [Paenibacillus solisilvae]|uniref:Hydroxymethylpyrimidine/phosphomethylpyrimidine kinase n=1 Tax=Paenibacillus solisilvae TaxID=2486751 RepID=A0ABW0VT06_9BACL
MSGIRMKNPESEAAAEAGSVLTDPPPRVLTIAGSDSGGGAGIQADLKTFQELGVYGMSAMTAVTSQNSLGIQAIYPLPEETVESQIESVLSDIGADAVKTGMLLTPTNVFLAASAIDRYSIKHVVIDPVLHAKDGSALLRQEAIAALKSELFPFAEVITPNVPEACELLGWPAHSIRTLEDMALAAQELLQLGPQYVFMKGGHLPADPSPSDEIETQNLSIDVLVGRKGSEYFREFYHAPRIPTKHTHGTGCTTASAIAAGLAHGYPLVEAVNIAKSFVTAAIQSAVPLGCGIGSLWHAAHRNKH